MSFRLIVTQLQQQTTKKSFSSVLLRRSKNKVDFRFKSTANTANNASASTTSASSSSTTASAAAETKEGGVPIAKSLLAMAAGVTTVSLGAAVVETATSSSVPPFDPSKQRFDQSTFIGRFSKMLLGCDPKLLLYSSSQVQFHQEQILNYQDILSSTPSDRLRSVYRDLWESQRIVTAALHPDTSETIPHPFRMSGYVPFNGPICVAMVASTSTPTLLFWSWVNQSQNALINYFNRNASTELDNATILKSYATAVGAALSVAFGLATFIQKRYDPVKARQLLRYVAFPSSVAASSLNCYIVRSPEISTGVKLVNDVGEDVLPGETSCEAAKRGVHSTTASRALLQAPVYFVPPVLLSTVPAFKNLLLRNPMATVPLTTYLLLVSFGLGLPATVAIFPQMSEIKSEEAEEKFRGLVDTRTGKPYEVFYYNKGL